MPPAEPSERVRAGAAPACCGGVKIRSAFILTAFSCAFLFNLVSLSDRLTQSFCMINSNNGENGVSISLNARRPLHSHRHTALLCAITKDEENYVDEWTDYHLGVGFTDILIYDNSVGNDLLTRRKKVRVGDERIEVIHWTDNGLLSTATAYNDCEKRAFARSRTWVAFLDVHEFLILRKHRNILSLLEEHCKFGVLSFNGYVFGAGENSAEPLTRRFTMRESVVDPHVKPVVRLSQKSFLNHPTFPNLLEGLQHDTNNKNFTGFLNPNGPVDVAVLHHYSTSIPWQSCEETINSSMTACGGNLDKRIFSVFDNSAWLELKMRVPTYSFFDKFYYNVDYKPPAQLKQPESNSPGNTVSLCTIVKDEHLYLDEWTDYNLAIGFTDIVIYDNSVANNLRQRMKRNRTGDEKVDIVHWLGDGQQLAAFRHCAKRCRAMNRTWAAFFDVDEYLVLRKHENILSLLHEYCQSGAVSFNWYLFGTSGLTAYSAEPVTRRFNMRAGHAIDAVKSVVKLSDWKGFENPHFPLLISGSQKDTNNRSFVGHRNANGRMDVASLNHYWSKSTKEFHWKGCIKGRVGERKNSSFHKENCRGKDLNVSLFSEYDNSAWLELTRRVPLYSSFNQFYEKA